MAATPEIKKPNEELTFSQKLYEFIQKNRRSLFVSLIVLIVILAGFIITVTVRERMQANALSTVDGFNRRFNELRFHLATGDFIQQTEIAILLLELQDFQNRASGFPVARSFTISASIHMEQERWDQAEEAWGNAARAAGRSYLVPISLFNAAVAAEEQGNIQAAIDYYASAIDFGDVFLAAPRAQFAIARLEEQRNNREAAIGAYRSLLARWPDDPVWSNLAQNRIIILSD
jgi:tetratricopeptide (TPR) repeat protein